MELYYRNGFDLQERTSLKARYTRFTRPPSNKHQYTPEDPPCSILFSLLGHPSVSYFPILLFGAPNQFAQGGYNIVRLYWGPK